MNDAASIEKDSRA